MTIPGIWDSGQAGQRATTCEIVLTNQRLIGYSHITFPRERLFLEDIVLVSVTNVSLRQKSFEPIFRELLVSDGQRKAYIRSSREKIELLYSALRSAIETHSPNVSITTPLQESEMQENTTRPAPIYGRQEIRTPFEQSLLGITILFIGGLLLEIIGVIAWSATHSGQVGLPLCIAGFICVLTATLLRRGRS